VTDAPPVVGRIKSKPEDFVVEEIPDGPLSGSGDHLYVWIEKRDLPAHELLRRLSHVLNLDAREVGTAGLKDARAITRQHVSLPARVENRLSAIEDNKLTVLSVSRHDVKLKTGHLQGNAFTVRVRGVALADMEKARVMIEKLRVTGVPNYFGAQRFGREGSTLDLGHRLFSGEHAPVSPMLRRLALSSVQSALFNASLAARVTDGLLTRVLRGDVIADRKLSIVSVAIDAEAEEERARIGRVATLGPIFGIKMREARHVVAEREAAVLAAAGLTRASFAPHRQLLPGTRRAYRIPLDALQFAPADDGFTIGFRLPAGGYATVVLNEVIRAQEEQGELEE
ncbi:MAG: tRNA pseudouridine(13) synthase TruD, partial [Clostridia bacterium]|nr:tRNA pseudouridine(13) synthase TruD [Deltaproteobacteria bacterium]